VFEMIANTKWQETCIGSEVDLKTGYPFKSSLYINDTSSPRLLRGDNVVQGRLRWDSTRYWPSSLIDDVSDYFLDEGDVVIAMDRPWIEAGLKHSRISKSDMPCLLVQRVARLRAKAKLDQGFLHYLIASKEFTDHVLSVQTGTSVPHISGEQIKEYRFFRPPMEEQLAIASILCTLDDKIELNYRINQTLEDMARAIFRSWFVDFEPVTAKREGRKPVGIDDATAALFPEHFQETAMGQIPAGWRLGKIGDIISLSKQSITPGDHPEENFSHYSIPAFDTGKLPILVQGSAIKSNKHIVLDGCVLISKLNPESPRVWLPYKRTDSKAICSTEFLVALPQNPFSTTYVYSFLSSDEFLGEFATFVTGTSNSHQRVKPDDFLRMDAVLPEPAVVLAFQKQMSILLVRAQKTHYESEILAALRDALLPELLSGELRVGQAEKIVG
jgi:type I restriction enzyme S subunit